MHETSITVPKSLSVLINKWRHQINVSKVCINALQKELDRLAEIAVDRRPKPKRRPRQKERYVNVRIEYAQELAERIAPYKPYLNISAVCSEAIETYILTLESLPEDVQRVMLQEG
jgi:post-segregation antitoxin (ccd killing protein)